MHSVQVEGAESQRAWRAEGLRLLQVRKTPLKNLNHLLTSDFLAFGLEFHFEFFVVHHTFLVDLE